MTDFFPTRKKKAYSSCDCMCRTVTSEPWRPNTVTVRDEYGYRYTPSVCRSLLLIPWLLLLCTFMSRAHTLLNHRHIFLKSYFWNWRIIRRPISQELMLNFNTCVLTWGSMLMSAVRVNAQALFLSQCCWGFACVCVCGNVYGISVFHPASWGSMLSGYSEGHRWHRGRGVSHHCHPSISFSLSCILISLLCGSWYVDFIKFSSGWVMEKTGGDQGSHSPLCCFHLSFLFPSCKGTVAVGSTRWKGSPGTSALFGHCVSGQLPDSIWRSASGKEIKRDISFHILHAALSLRSWVWQKGKNFVLQFCSSRQSSSINRN